MWCLSTLAYTIYSIPSPAVAHFGNDRALAPRQCGELKGLCSPEPVDALRKSRSKASVSWYDDAEAAEVSIAAASEATVDGSPPGTQRSDGTALALSPPDATKVACTNTPFTTYSRAQEPTPSEGGRQQAMLVLSALADLKRKPLGHDIRLLRTHWLCRGL